MRIITELTRGMTIKQKMEFKTNAKAFVDQLLYCLSGLSIAFVVFAGLLLLRIYLKSLS